MYMCVCIRVIRGMYIAGFSPRKFVSKLPGNTILEKKPKAPANSTCRDYYYLSKYSEQPN